MARLGSGGYLKGVEPATGGGEVLPMGWYRFMVTDSQYKPTKAGDGMCLHLFLSCLEPQYQGVEKRDFMTLEHPRQETVLIARAQLKALAVAVHYANPDQIVESSDLHQVPFMARLSVEDSADPKYGPQNRVREYLSIEAYRAKFGNGHATAPTQTHRTEAIPQDEEVPF